MTILSTDPDTRQIEVARLRRTTIEQIEHRVFLAKEDAEAFGSAHGRLIDEPVSNRLAAAALRAQAAALSELHRCIEELAAASEDDLPDLADRWAAALGLTVAAENRRVG